MSDQPAGLIELLQRGDERAFRFLVQEFQGRIYNFIYRNVGNRDDARDLTQETFLSVARAIERFRGDAALSTWIYQIALNKVRNHATRGRKHDHEDLDDHVYRLHAHQPTPEEETTGLALKRLLQEELSTMAHELSALIVLRDIEGRSYQEIERIMEIPLGTIKSRLHRARNELKRSVSRRWMKKP